MMHRNQIDPFDTDLLIEYDVRKLVKMTEQEAKHLNAELTVAKLQVVEYLRRLEKRKIEFTLKADFIEIKKGAKAPEIPTEVGDL